MDIFWVSQASEFLNTRKRIAYFPIKNTNLETIVTLLHPNVTAYCQRLGTTECHVHEHFTCTMGMSGEIDALHGWILIDWKASSTSAIMLEWIIQLLAYTYLCRVNNIEIKTIGIYNPISAILNTVDIDWWKMGGRLVKYLCK